AAGMIADLQFAASNTGDAAGDIYGSIRSVERRGGEESMRGNAWDNTIWGADGNDVLFGRSGADTLSGGDGDDVLFGGAGGDALSGRAGTDRAQSSDAAAGVIADLQFAASNTGDAAGDIYGSI